GRSSFIANHTTSFFLVSGFGSGVYSAKLLAWTRQRFSGFSHMRQCGDDVLRMLVTGGPGVRGDTCVRLPVKNRPRLLYPHQERRDIEKAAKLGKMTAPRTSPSSLPLGRFYTTKTQFGPRRADTPEV